MIHSRLIHVKMIYHSFSLPLKFPYYIINEIYFIMKSILHHDMWVHHDMWLYQLKTLFLD